MFTPPRPAAAAVEAPHTPTLDHVSGLLTRQQQTGDFYFGGQGRRGITNDIFFGLAAEGQQLKSAVQTLSSELTRQQRKVEELQGRIADSERHATTLQAQIAKLQQQTPPVNPAERARDQAQLRALNDELAQERARTDTLQKCLSWRGRARAGVCVVELRQPRGVTSSHCLVLCVWAGARGRPGTSANEFRKGGLRT
jgi:hypothetical protein